MWGWLRGAPSVNSQYRAWRWSTHACSLRARKFRKSEVEGGRPLKLTFQLAGMGPPKSLNNYPFWKTDVRYTP